MTGERISAQRAYELGFVNRVVEHGKALEAALELAQSICVNAPLAVQASKRIANGIIEGQVSAEDAAWALNDTETRAVMTSAHAKEGPLAFAEKRDPVLAGALTHQAAELKHDAQAPLHVTVPAGPKVTSWVTPDAEPTPTSGASAHRLPALEGRGGVLADHGHCSSGRPARDGSGASHAASQNGWRALRVHRHSAARVSVTEPPAAYIRRSPRTRKGPRSTARMVAGTSGCSRGIPGAW